LVSTHRILPTLKILIPANGFVRWYQLGLFIITVYENPELISEATNIAR